MAFFEYMGYRDLSFMGNQEKNRGLIMKKYCIGCGRNYEDTMGIWSCMVCGEDLQEGTSNSYSGVITHA